MATNKQRMISTRFWSDAFVVDKLNPLDRYLFLYFLTNERTNLSGVYEAPLTIISNETGLEKAEVERMMRNLVGKVEYKNGWVCLVNFTKHQNQENMSIVKGIENRLKDLPLEIQEWVKGLRGTSGRRVVDDKGTRGEQPNLTKPNLTKKNTIAAKAASRTKKKLKPKDDSEPYTREEFINKMRESKQPHVQWLADYTEERKIKFETKGQWRDYFSRNVKGASQIRKYSDEQIEKAFLMVEKNKKTKDNPKGYITKWGIETLLKFLDDANEE